jgi:hypothetical protein
MCILKNGKKLGTVSEVVGVFWIIIILRLSEEMKVEEIK